MSIPPSGGQEIDFLDRIFHVEVLRGGMNRLLLRSDRTSDFGNRVEILFMNVQYLATGTSFNGLRVRDIGPATGDDLPWGIYLPDELRIFELVSSSGRGYLVGGSMAVQESDAGPAEPSSFFMLP
jgi:hypothetical protein